MILQYQHIDILDKKVLERAVFRPPLREVRPLDNQACFLYNAQGELALFGPTQKVTLTPRQGLLMKCGNYVASHPVGSHDRAEMIAIHFYPEVLRHLYRDALPGFLTRQDDSSEESTRIVPVTINRMLEHFMEGLSFYFENAALASEELVTLKLKELILLLANSRTEQADRIKDVLHDLFNPHEADFKEIIQANRYENLSIAELATLTNMSLSSFKRKFQQVYQETPARYVRQQKLKRAAELLRGSQMRIQDIGYDCGFNDATSFSKLFTAYFGCSPSAFRDHSMD